ncbi:family 1 glycosylhydrolase [Novosphingobium sp. BL-8H]|uniref:glycoside hydrolase family 1 protein n=1 Tax=Novosphingobium sp. BL-8H TaxID=3127640 RepID=UPI00375646E7
MNDTLKRRDFLGAGAAVLAASALPSRSAQGRARKYSNDFLFGAATAGHQIEGNNTNSDIWFLENIKPTRFGTRSGDACDSYHRYEEDISLLKSFGLDTYRFSVEWSRIEPSPGQFSNAELDYYKRVIEACDKNGVRPVVTFNHFSCPQWFSALGGWTKPRSVDLFARYCDRVARQLASGMHMATTLNEPQLRRIQHWIAGLNSAASRATLDRQREAARTASGSPEYMAFHLADDDAVQANLINAHKQGYAAIKAVAPTLPVGVSLAVVDYQGIGDGSRVNEIREYVDGAWLRAAAETCDFVGVQNYGRDLVGPKGLIPAPASAERNMLTLEYYPAALGNTVRYVFEATRKPVLVSENGIATSDDGQRIRYIDDALAGLRSAMDEGVPVLGYIHWTLLDNFEWSLGYWPKFGLVAVDLKTFARTPKPSAYHLGRRARAWK